MRRSHRHQPLRPSCGPPESATLPMLCRREEPWLRPRRYRWSSTFQPSGGHVALFSVNKCGPPTITLLPFTTACAARPGSPSKLAACNRWRDEGCRDGGRISRSRSGFYGRQSWTHFVPLPPAIAHGLWLHDPVRLRMNRVDFPSG
jgi:hypothetical protein